MVKRETIAHLAQDKQEQMLLCQICERMEAAERKNIFFASGFLSEREQALVQQLLFDFPMTFFGGVEGAERKICCYLPDYFDEAELYGEQSPVCAVRAEFFEKDSLSHRDFLGALIAAGLKRSCIGDIFVQQGRADFLLQREMLPFILQNLRSAGKAALHLLEIPLSDLQSPEKTVRTLRETVPSLRLDCVLCAGFSISRQKAAEYIAAGKVELDHFLCQKAEKTVSEGAVLSARGLGKIQLISVDGTTRKGRIGVTINRFM